MANRKYEVIARVTLVRKIAGVFEEIKKLPACLHNAEFLEQLDQYKYQLGEEVDYLDLEYDHPLRAARALKLAIEHGSEDAINAFQKEAIDSKFYPKTRAIAWGIAVTLAFSAAICLIVVAVLFSKELAPELIAAGMGLCASVSLGVSMPLGMCFGMVKMDSYRPVTDARITGYALAKQLRLFKPPVATPVKDVDPLLVPTATPV